MALLAFLLFLIVPIIEIYVIVEVAGSIGWLVTLFLVVAVSLVGAWLVRQQGLAVLSRLRRRTSQGELPGAELVDGALVLFAGALLLTPGFVTDAVGLALLFPPTRIPVRELLLVRWRAGIAGGRIVVGGVSGMHGATRRRRSDVIDVDGEAFDADVVDAEDVGEDPPSTELR